jgi:hypothetical protein
MQALVEQYRGGVMAIYKVCTHLGCLTTGTIKKINLLAPATVPNSRKMALILKVSTAKRPLYRQDRINSWEVIAETDLETGAPLPVRPTLPLLSKSIPVKKFLALATRDFPTLFITKARINMLKSINFQDLRQKMATAIDNRVRIITAGLGLNELRAVLRGDPPTEKPNPRYKVHTTSFLFHIRPRYYQKGSTILSHTFRLGFFTFFFFMVELFTGLILMVYYSPTPSEAYSSILKIMSDVPFGNLMRDLHRIGAEAMVIFTFLHMLRTYFTGSYKKERSFTWFTGIILLGITLFLYFWLLVALGSITLAVDWHQHGEAAILSYATQLALKVLLMVQVVCCETTCCM